MGSPLPRRLVGSPPISKRVRTADTESPSRCKSLSSIDGRRRVRLPRRPGRRRDRRRRDRVHPSAWRLTRGAGFPAEQSLRARQVARGGRGAHGPGDDRAQRGHRPRVRDLHPAWNPNWDDERARLHRSMSPVARSPRMAPRVRRGLIRSARSRRSSRSASPTSERWTPTSRSGVAARATRRPRRDSWTCPTLRRAQTA